ncbi:hypothetical protein [Weissella koreensis]|uniref:hypothetical protein n=1 Tax=Weissella koreensis TaxID=165096 RepID=UPI000CF311DC|nr:hypothetical protein [Weissella koreensis]AVH75874.1 hypothetical protein C4597_07535 [Weissella koreensis]
MVEKNEYTIQQIADIAGTSKITMYRFIVSGQYHETTVKRNAKIYNETVKSLIISDFNAKHDVSTASFDETVETHSKKDDYSKKYIASLKEQIEQLQDFNNKQSNNIKSIQKSLDQAQQLQLIAEQRLTDEHQKVIELSEQNQKKSFWKRLFG